MWNICRKCVNKVSYKLDAGGRLKRYCLDQEKFLVGKEPKMLDCYTPKEEYKEESGE